MTQSEAVVKIINSFGNCIGYYEVCRIDTCWSEEQVNANSSLPVNMASGKITRAAVDNFNRATESLGGVHHDVVNMVFYQLCSDGYGIGGFGNTVRASKERRRSLENDIRNKEMLRCANIGGKQPHPQHLLRKIKLEWLLHCSKEHQNMGAFDHAFIPLRMTPTRLFSVDFRRNAPQKMPGWTVYHPTATSDTNIRKTNILYCPMVHAPATEFNTVYTVTICLQSMFRL